MAKKVIYFTASINPTTDELAAIAALNARAVPTLEVVVRNGAADAGYGAGRNEPADFVAGTRPAAYPVETYPAPPAGLGNANGTTQAVVTHGVAVAGVTLTGTAGADKTMTLTIANGVITAAAFA